MHNSFPEEKLDSPAGYLATQHGETLDNGRWRIIRKLGWGPRSSTWLGVDTKDPDNISALKVFTIAAIRDSTAETEREFLQHSVKKIDDNVPVIVSAFYEESVRGKHLCLELHVLGTSVEALRVTNTLDGGYLPIHTVQKVVFDVLGPLSQLHKQMIIHGAVTADNFLFWTVQTGQDIQEYLADAPSCEKVEQGIGNDGTTYPIMKSQPLANGFKWNESLLEIANAGIHLNIFSHVHRSFTVGKYTGAVNVTPPEVLQGEKLTIKSDIWMLGCTAYLLLTGSELFSESYFISPVETATKTVSKLEDLLLESGKLAPNDIPAAAAFLRLSCSGTSIEVSRG